MKISDLKVGDRLEDYRRGVVFVIKRSAPCGSCPCGWGEISYEEIVPIGHVHLARKRCKTFKQFERLRFIRRAVNRGTAVPCIRQRSTSCQSYHKKCCLLLNTSGTTKDVRIKKPPVFDVEGTIDHIKFDGSSLAKGSKRRRGLIVRQATMLHGEGYENTEMYPRQRLAVRGWNEITWTFSEFLDEDPRKMTDGRVGQGNETKGVTAFRTRAGRRERLRRRGGHRRGPARKAVLKLIK